MYNYIKINNHEKKTRFLHSTPLKENFILKICTYLRTSEDISCISHPLAPTKPCSHRDDATTPSPRESPWFVEYDLSSPSHE